jgi:filamin
MFVFSRLGDFDACWPPSPPPIGRRGSGACPFLRIDVLPPRVDACKDTAGNMSGRGAVSVLGDIVQHVAAGMEASAELSAAGFGRESIDINVLSPSKVPVSYRLKEEGSEGGGLFTVAFKPTEVGTYVMDVYVSGQKLPESPVLFKVYNSALILVSELRNGVVGQPCQFRVDASQAGEGQLEISINDGEVPNHVQVLGGGRCLVHFTPEVAKPHVISIAFNGEPVPNSPFCLAVSDIGKTRLRSHSFTIQIQQYYMVYHIVHSTRFYIHV